MTHSASTARNHKLTYQKLRAGSHAFLAALAANFESVGEDVKQAIFAGDTEAVGSGALGSLYYLRSNGNYDLALDLGPANRANRYGLVYCIGAAGAGSTFDSLFFLQGNVRMATSHGATPGIYGYLSSTTPGLIVPNEGATSGFSDASDSANPIIVCVYHPGNLIMFNTELIY